MHSLIEFFCAQIRKYKFLLCLQATSLKNVNFNIKDKEKEITMLQKLQLERESTKEAKGEIESREKLKAKNKRRLGYSKMYQVDWPCKLSRRGRTGWPQRLQSRRGQAKGGGKILFSLTWFLRLD